jgi:hypothetical protein
MPAVVYLGYSVHGNEASGTEAAMLLLYHLAAGTGPAISSVLDSTIVIIDPMLNPDGRDRFVDWVNGYRGSVVTADPEHRELREPWPFGRTNHYLFDLNRDWLPAVHAESQGRLELFHNWRPQVVGDFHEMGSDATFFFQPGIPSRVNPNTPPENQELTARIARYHARRLDQLGSLYYSRESFDDFFYGKGSTYPDVNGAVGILFEQASSEGLNREVRSGRLTYEFTIRNQFVASLSTLEAVAGLRHELLSYHRGFYAQAGASGEEGGYAINVLDRETSAHALVALLKRHRVETRLLAKDVMVDGLEFKRGRDFIVQLSQPQSRLLRAFLEPQLTFSDSLFYDVSAWSLPMAFDLDVRRVSRDADELAGPVVEERSPLRPPARSEYAYLMEWTPLFAARALQRLHSDGMQARVAMKPFDAATSDGLRHFERGTVIVPVPEAESDSDRLHELMETIVRDDAVPVYAASSGLSEAGIDFGSPKAKVVRPRSVAIVSGDGTRVYGVGSSWYVLSSLYQLPVSLIDISRLGSMDLRRYDVIVLPPGTYDTTHSSILREWVEEDGGHLVTFASASVWAAGQGFVDADTSDVDVDSLALVASFEDVETVRGAQRISGTVLKTRLDRTHPVAFGAGSDLPVFRTHRTFLSKSATPGATVAVYDDDPLLSGYLPEEAAAALPGSSAIIARRLGKGRVVAFADDPVFRGFWLGGMRVFMNAVMLSDLF